MTGPKLAEAEFLALFSLSHHWPVFDGQWALDCA